MGPRKAAGESGIFVSMREQDQLKPIYRRVLRRFHPDMTTDPLERVAFGDLTRDIIDAYKNGDEDTLREIEQLGTAFRKRQPEAEEPPDFDTPQASQPVASATSAKVKEWGCFLAPFWFPYALAFAIRSWDQNRKPMNAACIAGAVPWTWLGLQLWGGIDGLASRLTELGYSHESLAGLMVVLLRGALLAALLPVVIPLGLVALRVGWLIGSVWVAHWVLAGVLGYFHPYLAWIATIGLGLGLAVALWRSLDEW